MDDARKLISKALELGFTVCVFDEHRTVLNESRDYGEVVRAVEGLDQCLLHFNVCKKGTAAIVRNADGSFSAQDYTLDDLWIAEAIGRVT